MIKIKPTIQQNVLCPYCRNKAASNKVLWQGIHVVVEASCHVCNVELLADLPIGQAIYTPYLVNKLTGEVFGSVDAMSWFGRPLLDSLRNPDSNHTVEMQVEKRRQVESVIVLNCIDYLYGHSLLKLLNADAYRAIDGKKGLVVIVPNFLRWMVPDYVAEIWTVNIPLSSAQKYFPSLHAAIDEQMTRFKEVSVSLAYSHPAEFNITNFTGVLPHGLTTDRYRVTFVWREDRVWPSRWMAKLLPAFKLDLFWQNRNIMCLFRSLKNTFPLARFTVAGLGKTTRFPEWVEDARVQSYDADSERVACHVYSESRLVIGVHGSNMLLPSAHAWAAIDLMPNERWGNLAQDILYQYGDNEAQQITSWRYRFLPIRITGKQVALIAKTILLYSKVAIVQFSTNRANEEHV